MAAHKPLIISEGTVQQLPVGDTLEVVDAAIASHIEAQNPHPQYAVASFAIEHDQVAVSDWAIPSTKNAISLGPITIATGVIVEIAQGASWRIL